MTCARIISSYITNIDPENPEVNRRDLSYIDVVEFLKWFKENTGEKADNDVLVSPIVINNSC